MHFKRPPQKRSRFRRVLVQKSLQMGVPPFTIEKFSSFWNPDFKFFKISKKVRKFVSAENLISCFFDKIRDLQNSIWTCFETKI